MGEEVRVEGMSDGTTDQLYLALRLASVSVECTLNNGQIVKELSTTDCNYSMPNYPKSTLLS